VKRVGILKERMFGCMDKMFMWRGFILGGEAEEGMGI
jgi:hypothetical protein